MRLRLAVLWLVACVALGAAQDEKGKKKGEQPKPDLNGTWVRDNPKSDFGRYAASPLAKAEATLVIESKEPEIKMTRTVKIDGQDDARGYTYYSDGRGETNPPLLGQGEVKSKTKWDGAKLVAKASTSRQTPNGAVYTEIVEKWEVSADGKTLTDTLSYGSAAMGSQTFRQVFNRAL